MEIDNSYFLEKLKDENYLKEIKEKILKAKEESKNFKIKTKRINNLKNQVNLKDLIEKYNLEPFIEDVNKLIQGYDAFLITSRGELVPYLFIKEELEPLPVIASFKNLIGNHYLKAEAYPLIVEKIAERFARSPYEKVISVDEAVTYSSLLFRVNLIKDIKILEERIKEKILPNILFFNFASPNYYGEDSFSSGYYLKIRKKNVGKIKELIKNLPVEFKEKQVIEIPWQDNDNFYNEIISSYLPFPRIDYDLIKDSLKSRYGKNYVKSLESLLKELSLKHREITKEFLKKIRKNEDIGINGLYISKNSEYESNFEEFLKEYARKSAEITEEVLSKYFKGVITLYYPEENLYSIERIKKKSKKHVKYQRIAEVHELVGEKEEKNRSGLRLILNIKE